VAAMINTTAGCDWNLGSLRLQSGILRQDHCKLHWGRP